MQKIPIGFLKYLKGYDQYEHAILRRVKKCLVKLNEHRFEEGRGKHHSSDWLNNEARFNIYIYHLVDTKYDA